MQNPDSKLFVPLATTNAEIVNERPSLSYAQDAWLRLRQNTRAMASLAVVIAMLLFCLAGPYIWRIDPLAQNLDLISSPASFNLEATIIEDHPPVLEHVIADMPESTPGMAMENLQPVEDFKVVGQPTMSSVQLSWKPVIGASSYLIYRSEKKPTSVDSLGLPIGEIPWGNQSSYEDRLKLKPVRYHYSIRPGNGLDYSPHFTSVEAVVPRTINLQEARERGLGDQPGKTIELEAHPLGTDYLGRDILSRLMAGGRISLLIGIFAPLAYILMGLLYGAISGSFGGRVDMLMMRFADFVMALPFLLFMIVFRVALGVKPGDSGLFALTFSLIVLSWPGAARLVRGQILQIREEAYVQAARLIGAPRFYVIWRHMLPNTLGVLLVTITFAIPSAIFAEAFLSFIGFGIAPPNPSWGSMCNDSLDLMLTHPRELLYPAGMISLTVLAFNTLGDGLRDALDAKMRSR